MFKLRLCGAVLLLGCGGQNANVPPQPETSGLVPSHTESRGAEVDAAPDGPWFVRLQDTKTLPADLFYKEAGRIASLLSEGETFSVEDVCGFAETTLEVVADAERLRILGRTFAEVASAASSAVSPKIAARAAVDAERLTISLISRELHWDEEERMSTADALMQAPVGAPPAVALSNVATIQLSGTALPARYEDALCLYFRISEGAQRDRIAAAMELLTKENRFVRWSILPLAEVPCFAKPMVP